MVAGGLLCAGVFVFIEICLRQSSLIAMIQVNAIDTW